MSTNSSTKAGRRKPAPAATTSPKGSGRAAKQTEIPKQDSRSSGRPQKAPRALLNLIKAIEDPTLLAYLRHMLDPGAPAAPEPEGGSQFLDLLKSAAVEYGPKLLEMLPEALSMFL
jgi:hypothetical protein